jgi:hypoxanthine phosphoribosyltransferase
MNWDEFELEIDRLAKKVTAAPDIIIGIARGGVVPAMLLSKRLRVKDMLVLKVRKEGNERKVVGDIVTDVSGKSVLLVEDMIESGKSLIVAKDYLEKSGATVRTACLYTMPLSEMQPDFFLGQVQEVQEFPWE